MGSHHQDFWITSFAIENIILLNLPPHTITHFLGTGMQRYLLADRDYLVQLQSFPPNTLLHDFQFSLFSPGYPASLIFFPLLFSLVVPSLGLCNEWSSQRKLLETLLIRVSQLFSLQFRLESQLDTSWFKKSNKGQSSATGKALSPCALLIFFFLKWPCLGGFFKLT